ncbi:ankyrin repeat-containing domain protein [Trichoderma chlorosporum]
MSASSILRLTTPVFIAPSSASFALETPCTMEEDMSTMRESHVGLGNDRGTMEGSKNKPGLLRIPNEIIRQIGGCLEDKGDIAALIRTCRLFNMMFGDVLYQRDQLYHRYKQDSCLTWAATLDRADTLKRAVKAGVRLEDHSYLIFVVSCTGSPKCAEVVLSTPGINPMAEDERGWTPITLAASFGHASVVKKLIEHGADYTALTRFGWSPFNVACCHGSLGVAKLLLDEYGVSMKGDYGINWSALRSASTYGHADILTYLLQRGADTAAEEGGWSCLHIAADGGHTEAVEVLLNHGFDPSAVANELGWTPLTLAVDKGHHDTVELLLDRGVDIEQKCTNQWTSLCMAATRGDLKMVMLLVGRGANVMAKAIGGWTPITLAAANGHQSIVDLLLAYGADIYMKAWALSGWTPLMVASDSGHATLARMLLPGGVDVQTGNSTGWNYILSSADGRHLMTSRIILNFGFDIMPTFIAGHAAGIRAAHTDRHRLLSMLFQAYDLQLDHLDSLGRSAFVHAAMRGHRRVIKISLPLTSMANRKNRYKSNPIFAAAGHGHRRVVELVDEGLADFAERDLLNCALLAQAQRAKRRQLRYLKRHTMRGDIPVGLEYPASKQTQHKRDYIARHCNVCDRASVHLRQAHVCDDCGGSMIACTECINESRARNSTSHLSSSHRRLCNDSLGRTLPLLRASASLHNVTELDNDGTAVGDLESIQDGDGDALNDTMMMRC